MRGGQPAPGQRGDQLLGGQVAAGRRRAVRRPGRPGAAARRSPGRASARRTGCRGPRRPARTRRDAAPAGQDGACARSSAGLQPGRTRSRKPPAQSRSRTCRHSRPPGLSAPTSRSRTSSACSIRSSSRVACTMSKERWGSGTVRRSPSVQRARPGWRAHRGPGDRLVVVDQAEAEIRAGRPQAGRAEVAGRGDRPGQQHGDRLPETLAGVPLRPVAEQRRLRGRLSCGRAAGRPAPVGRLPGGPTRGCLAWAWRPWSRATSGPAVPPSGTPLTDVTNP